MSACPSANHGTGASHERAILPVLVILGLQAAAVAIAVLSGASAGVAVVLVFPVEGLTLFVARRHYVRAARMTISNAELVLERPYLGDRRIRAADVNLVLLVGQTASVDAYPFVIEPSQLLVLGTGRTRPLLRLSGEIWPADRFVEIGPALSVRSERVGRMSKKEIHRRYGAKPGLWCP